MQTMETRQAAEAATAPGREEDERLMRLALDLGRRGLGRAWPNPAVGAVIVKDGVILGRGWTQPGGRPHAEAEALRRAGKAARGATLYVTLEPCAHHGKTPPCAEALVKAGIARVVSALEDPNPQVAGRGHATLRAHGIAVEVGLLADAARHMHVGHVLRVTERRPHVLLKLAVSADGKAGRPGRRPAAISGEQARARVFQLRAQSDAILVGIGTVLADHPQLTCRLPGMLACSPVRVVLDAGLRAPLATPVIATAREIPTWFFASRAASRLAGEILEQRGCRVFRVDAQADGRLDLGQVLRVLAEEGITRLMVEGGPRVAASFAAADFVDELVLLRSQRAMGEGIAPLEGLPLEALVARMTMAERESLGADSLERYRRC